MTHEERVEAAAAEEQRLIEAFARATDPERHNPWLHNLARMKMREWQAGVEARRHQLDGSRR